MILPFFAVPLSSSLVSHFSYLLSPPCFPNSSLSSSSPLLLPNSFFLTSSVLFVLPTSQLSTWCFCKLFVHCNHLESLFKHQWLTCIPSVLISRSGWRPDNLHFSQFPRCCSWEHTLRTTSLTDTDNLVCFQS